MTDIDLDAPTTDEVREAYVHGSGILPPFYDESFPAAVAERKDWFDRWLAEVRATALEEAADDYERESGTSNGTIPWLRTRAARIREGKTA